METDPKRNHLTRYEQWGRGQIDVYGIESDQQLSLVEMRRALPPAERIREITYSRNGASWFVVSGHYRRLPDEAIDLIFYAKVMISADRRSVSVFEASYPLSGKKRLDPVIERMEDSLTRPPT